MAALRFVSPIPPLAHSLVLSSLAVKLFLGNGFALSLCFVARNLCVSATYMHTSILSSRGGPELGHILTCPLSRQQTQKMRHSYRHDSSAAQVGTGLLGRLGGLKRQERNDRTHRPPGENPMMSLSA
jgi:hypothetical protein